MQVGYGVCGKGEADRYLEKTLKEFKRLTDKTVILCNNTSPKEDNLIRKYNFDIVKDSREWGKNQHKIKQNFVKNVVAKYNPDTTICLDMDETFTKHVNYDTFRNLPYEASKVYVCNLWGRGYRDDWSFWNVRTWHWNKENMERLGNYFFEFEKRPLHCGLAPKWTYHLELCAPIILKHYGLKRKEDRQRKIRRYEKYDPKQIYREPAYYKALNSDKYEPFDEDKMQEIVEKEIERLKQPLNKKIPMKKKKKKSYLVLREYDEKPFEVEEQHLDWQLSQKYPKGGGFRLVSDRPIGEKDEKKEEGEKDPLVCDVCGFKAKSAFGLRSHARKHK